MAVLDNLLDHWAGVRSTGPPRRDQDGRHYYVFDGEFEVALSQLGDAIYLETDLTDLPKRRDEAEAVLERLLKMQLARSGEEILAVKPDRDQLMLFGILRADRIDLRGFETALGRFVNAAAFWMKQLEPGAQPAVSVGAGPAAEQIFFP